MKSILLVLFSLTLSTALTQKEAGIFYISMHIDEDLQNELEMTHKERNFLSGYSSSPHFPGSLIEKMRDSIAKSVGEILNADAECIYSMNRKGDTVYTIGLADELEGMPVERKNKAIRTHDKDIYVRLNIWVKSSGGVSVGLPNGTHSKLKPMIKYVLVAYNKEGNKIYKEKVKVKDFGTLKSVEKDSKNGEWRVKESEVLQPEDVFAMLLKAIEKFEMEHI
ncbi:MAG: hypothetical protein WED10_02905 [Brumimicrobium sp.]